MTTENYIGSDLSGTTGSSNRVLTIGNVRETSNDSFQVFVNNSFLHLSIDYSVDHNESNTQITFLNPVWDDQNITVIYSFGKALPSEGESGIIPLDTQYINNEINYFGDTITIRAVTNLDYDIYGNAQQVLGDSKISYTSGDDALLSFYNSNWIAQTFTTDSSFNTTSIKIKIKRTGTPGAITVSIRAIDGNSKPTGSDLTSGTLDYTDLIDDGDTEWMVLPLTDYTLSASTTYALVIRASGGDNSNKFEARIKTAGTYSGGNNLISSDSGGTWTTGSSDILFDLYGDTEATCIVDVLTQEDEAVKSGQFQSGDKRFFFQNAESNIIRGTKIKHNSLWYEIDEIITDSLGDVTYCIEALGKKI